MDCTKKKNTCMKGLRNDTRVFVNFVKTLVFVSLKLGSVQFCLVYRSPCMEKKGGGFDLLLLYRCLSALFVREIGPNFAAIELTATWEMWPALISLS